MRIGFLAHYNLGLYIFRAPIMRRLVKEGCEVYAICPKGKFDDEIEKMGVKVVNYEITRRSVNPFNEFKTLYNIYKALKNLNLDALHTFTVKPNVYGTFIGSFVKIPKIFNLIEGLGSLYVEDSFKNQLIRGLVEFLYRQTFKISDGCIFVNDSDPEYYIEQNIIKRGKVTVIKSVGIDAQIFSMENINKEELGLLKSQLQIVEKKVVLMVARAIWHKGVREYYECAKEIKRKRDDVEFLLVGGTDEGNPSCADENFLKSGDVKWLGERNDIATCIALSDICVLPSFYKEGLSRSLLESASMSKPIVTTNITGCKDVVDDGINGYLVEPQNVSQLVYSVEKLLDDENLRLAMGKNSRKKVMDNFEEQHVVAQYIKFYIKFGCLKGESSEREI